MADLSFVSRAVREVAGDAFKSVAKRLGLKVENRALQEGAAHAVGGSHRDWCW